MCGIAQVLKKSWMYNHHLSQFSKSSLIKKIRVSSNKFCYYNSDVGLGYQNSWMFLISKSQGSLYLQYFLCANIPDLLYVTFCSTSNNFYKAIYLPFSFSLGSLLKKLFHPLHSKIHPPYWNIYNGVYWERRVRARKDAFCY